MSLELWGGLAGNKSIVDNVVREGKFFLRDIEETDYAPKRESPHDGMSPAARRKLQIEKRSSDDRTPYLDKSGLTKLFENLPKPFHFIDFETSAVAVPFHKGRRPYEEVAFQYSYHVMNEDGSIEHKSEYLSLENNFPNYSFVRALRADLEGKEGTIFRYHNHENNYLRAIYRQLKAVSEQEVPDKWHLMNFIKNISHGEEAGEEWIGKQDMVDLWKIVLEYYYSPIARGSNSIKDILPSVIYHSEYLRQKYSKPIYGTELIPSKNFTNHSWITQESNFNPYLTLPKVLSGYDNMMLEEYAPGFEDLKDGGAAMMAYAYLQHSGVSQQMKDQVSSALLRYCELDTMAMVMIWEYWGKEIGYF